MPPAPDYSPASPTALAAVCWAQAMAQIDAVLRQHQLHPSEVVVLLPYLQLIPEARQAWALHVQAAGRAVFVPRFETTQTWASRESGVRGLPGPSATDLRLDLALDRLTAVSLLQRANLAERPDALASRLVEQAWSLARVAAAIAPQQRLQWGEQLRGQLQLELSASALRFESALASTALAWAATSAYPTDCLFDAQPALLAVLCGFQSDPVADALRARLGQRAVEIKLCAVPDSIEVIGEPPTLQEAADAEDEASRAAACVLAHLAERRSPVALVAQDRLLTRRVGAMLHARGVAMRDETGWKLSTTRAAASVMNLLRAASADVATDAVIDWLKNAPAFSPIEVDALEAELRREGVRSWRDLPNLGLIGETAPAMMELGRTAAFAVTRQLAAPVQLLRGRLQPERRLTGWLAALREALAAAGQWSALSQDDAGQAVLHALRLHEGAEVEFEAAPSMTLAAFTHWVGEVLEGATFAPPPVDRDAADQLVILPLGQLLGRSVHAVVIPGCDEIRLPVSPEPPGQWTPVQRNLLGLASREALAASTRAAWDYAMRLPHVDLLWRRSEAGESLMASGLIQQRLLDLPMVKAPDARAMRMLDTKPTERPMPTGDALPVTRLSASAYEDLRRCPYRFFAMRQLKVQEPDELESEVGKRDFGNWLHRLLHHFHCELQTAPTHDERARVAMINGAAERATRELGFSAAEFLPFAAAWPRVRSGYLEWLATHEAGGAVYETGEDWREMRYGELTLVGKLDRIDTLADEKMVLDYKTESWTHTASRIKNGAEDTQLAFYAALLDSDTLQAAYVNVGEKGETKSAPQREIVPLRDQLIASIMTDMTRIAHGQPLPALGEGQACDYCAARGLCRKDFWSE